MDVLKRSRDFCLHYNWSQGFPSTYHCWCEISLGGAPLPESPIKQLFLTGLACGFLNPVIFMIRMNITTCPVNRLFQMLRMCLGRKKEKSGLKMVSMLWGSVATFFFFFKSTEFSFSMPPLPLALNLPWNFTFGNGRLHLGRKPPGNRIFVPYPHFRKQMTPWLHWLSPSVICGLPCLGGQQNRKIFQPFNFVKSKLALAVTGGKN